MAFAQANNTLAMNIQREDPVLVSLLRGQATAAVTADAIEGKLSANPESYDDRMKAQRQARMQQLADNNPFKAGNVTEALEVASLNPELARRLKREAGIGDDGSLAVNRTPEELEQQRAALRAQEARVEGMNHSQQRVRRGAIA